VSITYDGTICGPVAGRSRPAPRIQAQRGQAARRVPAQPVRLTRRGRLTVVLLLLAVLVVGLSVGMVSQAAGPSRPHVQPTVTVQPGESLWQVAVRVAPGADPRLVVDELVRANHLPGATVVAGQQLVVPGQ